MSRCDTATLPIAPQGPAARPNARVPAKAGMALRLCMDASATALLLLCMAYWWLDNATHEWAGAAMFGLLLARISRDGWDFGAATVQGDDVHSGGWAAHRPTSAATHGSRRQTRPGTPSVTR